MSLTVDERLSAHKTRDAPEPPTGPSKTCDTDPYENLVERQLSHSSQLWRNRQHRFAPVRLCEKPVEGFLRRRTAVLHSVMTSSADGFQKNSIILTIAQV